MSVPFRVLVTALFCFLLRRCSWCCSPASATTPSWPSRRTNGAARLRRAAANQTFRHGFGVSVTLAAVATLISLAAGTAAAYAIARSRFVGRDAALALFTAPLLLPGIILGLGLLLVFAQFGLLATLAGAGGRALPGHAALRGARGADRATRHRCDAGGSRGGARGDPVAHVPPRHAADDAARHDRGGRAVLPRLVRRGGDHPVPGRAAVDDAADRGVAHHPGTAPTRRSAPSRSR